MLLITGATGNVGSELVKDLTAAGVEARVLVRDVSKAPAGMSAVSGDFLDADSMKRALDGVDTAFLMAPFVPTMVDLQAAFIEAARVAGVKHIVKLSAMGTAVDASVTLLRWHGSAEKILKESGIAWTCIQPNGFMQNLLGQASLIANQGIIPAPAADARISHIDLRDIAASIAKVLTSTGHEGKTYVLTGPAAITYNEMAADVSAAIGKPVNYVPITSEQFTGALTSMGMPAWLAEGLDELYAFYRTGAGSMVTADVETLTGRPATTFAQFASDFAGVLGNSPSA